LLRFMLKFCTIGTLNKKQISEVMRAMGRKGGKAGGQLGGKARAETLTPEQRSEIARKAAAKSAEVRSKRAAAKKRARNKRSGN
jgi:hypothetical protein